MKNNKFLNWYKNLSLPLKASFWFAVSNILQRGISFITTPIFSRILSEEQYGIYSTYVTWQSLLLIIISLSLYKSLMNLFVKREDHNHVLSSVVMLSLLITSSFFIIALIFVPYISELLKIPMPLVICLAVYIVFFPVFECWTIKQQYSFDYKKVVITTLLSVFLSTTIGVLCVAFINSSALFRALPQTAIVAIIGIILLIFIFKNNNKVFDKKIWLFSLSFCLPLLPHYLSEFILSGSDKLMINYMCSAESVAVYSIAYSTGSVINLFTSAINSAFAPYQYKMIKAKEYYTLNKVANIVMIVVALALCLIMLFGHEIILIFGGEKYIEAEACVIPICIGLFFNYLFQLFARVQEYYEKKLFVVIPSVLCAILNIVLNYFFIKIYGYIAASYTTAICYFVFCMLHLLFYLRTCKKQINGEQIYNIKSIMIISFLFLALSIFALLIKDNLRAKIAIICFAIVLAVMMKDKILYIYNIFIKKKK